MGKRKPTFSVDQLVPSSDVSKKFAELRKKAKELQVPLFIMENGNVDTVLIGYDYFEEMYQRLRELEEKEEERIIIERIERLKKDPSSAVSWKSIRRSGKDNG